MTLQQTLTTNSSPASLGGVQIQPIDATVSVFSSNKTQSLNSSGNINVSDVPISPSIIKIDDDKIDVVNNVSLNEIVELLSSNDRYALSPLDSKYNRIAPAYSNEVTVTQAQTQRSQKINSDYENLTNVSSQRPEIIASVDFLPLFTKSVLQQSVVGDDYSSCMTSAGKFIEQQINVKNLLLNNVVALLRDLANVDRQVDITLSTRKDKFIANLQNLRSLSQYLFVVLNNINIVKHVFNLHDSSYDANINDLIDAYTFGYVTDPDVANVLKQSIARYTTFDLSIANVFSNMLGYTSNNFVSFSSTKIWSQLVSEFRDVLKYHSLRFMNISTNDQKNDKSPTNILQNTASYTYILSKQNLITNAMLMNSNVNDGITTVFDCYRALYSNASFKNDELKYAMLSFLLSKEYRLSNGLANPSIVDTLSKFGYTVKTGDITLATPQNIGMFDAVFGNQKNITDFLENDSMLSITQRVDNNQNILTFESEYVSNGTTTFVPGTNYYFDSSDITNVEKLRSLLTTLQAKMQSFSNFIELMNLIYSKPTSSNSYESALNSPIDFLGTLYSDFNKMNVTSDELCPLFLLANNDITLKSQLFLYVFMLAFNEKNITADIMPDIDGMLRSKLSNMQALPQQLQTDYQITGEGLTSLLANKTGLVNFAVNAFQGISAAFQKNAISDQGRTKYGGISDLSVLLVLFDLIVTLCAKHATKKFSAYTYVNVTTTQITAPITDLTIAPDAIVSKTTTSTLTYILTQNSSDTYAVRNAFNILNQEVAISQQLFYCVFNILKNLQTVILGHINFVSLNFAKDLFSQISSIVGDQKKTSMLMGNQQIMLLNNTITNLYNRFVTYDKPLSNVEITSLFKSILYNVFSDKMFVSDGNKKVLSVGIPIGLTDSLKQQVNISKLTSFKDKQIDIINVTVYKIDLVNDDIIFKPIQYMFDLSRFVSKDDQTYASNANKTLLDAVASIPTRDISRLDRTVTDLPELQYYSEEMFDQTYDFLSKEQKYQIARNHVLSYMLETYVSLMSGVSLSDEALSFNKITKMVGSETVRKLIDSYVSFAIAASDKDTFDKSGGILFSTTYDNSTALEQNNNQQSPITSISQVSQHIYDSVLHGIRTISNFAYANSVYADTDVFSTQIFSPCVFDRVLNVFVDSNEFEIDVSKTVQSWTGAQTLNQLITSGKVIATIPGTTTLVPNNLASAAVTSIANNERANAYTYKNKSSSMGESTFEKYFVTIETVLS